jgi:hypothetical protein
MVPDKDGFWYHKGRGICEVDLGLYLVLTTSGGLHNLEEFAAPTDWLGPVPTAEEWAQAQARMARMEAAIELAVERFEDEADKWREGIDDEDGFNKDLMDRYAADLRKALEP